MVRLIETTTKQDGTIWHSFDLLPQVREVQGIWASVICHIYKYLIYTYDIYISPIHKTLFKQKQKEPTTFSGENPIPHNNSRGTLMKVSRDHKMTVRSTEPREGDWSCKFSSFLMKLLWRNPLDFHLKFTLNFFKSFWEKIVHLPDMSSSDFFL